MVDDFNASERLMERRDWDRNRHAVSRRPTPVHPLSLLVRVSLVSTTAHVLPPFRIVSLARVNFITSMRVSTSTRPPSARTAISESDRRSSAIDASFGHSASRSPTPTARPCAAQALNSRSSRPANIPATNMALRYPTPSSPSRAVRPVARRSTFRLSATDSRAFRGGDDQCHRRGTQRSEHGG